MMEGTLEKPTGINETPELVERGKKLVAVCDRVLKDVNSALAILDRLEELQKSPRDMTKKKPITSRMVAQWWDEGAEPDEVIIAKLMDEIEYRCQLPIVESELMLYQAYYLKADEAFVDKCRAEFATLKERLKEDIAEIEAL